MQLYSGSGGLVMRWLSGVNRGKSPLSIMGDQAVLLAPFDPCLCHLAYFTSRLRGNGVFTGDGLQSPKPLIRLALKSLQDQWNSD
jgi:hypothetical protein